MPSPLELLGLGTGTRNPGSESQLGYCNKPSNHTNWDWALGPAGFPVPSPSAQFRVPVPSRLRLLMKAIFTGTGLPSHPDLPSAPGSSWLGYSVLTPGSSLAASYSLSFSHDCSSSKTACRGCIVFTQSLDNTCSKFRDLQLNSITNAGGSGSCWQLQQGDGLQGNSASPAFLV